MELRDRQQLPLTARGRVLLGVGVAMFVAQIVAAALLARPTTGEGDAEIGVLAALWAASLVWSVVIVLFIVRQTDLPDIATASMLVMIPPYALYALIAAYDVPKAERDAELVDSLFLGVTGGALTGMIVWGIAMGIARLLKLPVTEPPADEA